MASKVEKGKKRALKEVKEGGVDKEIEQVAAKVRQVSFFNYFI